MRLNDLVERALKEYPETRSSDRKLMMTVWWYQDANYMTDFKHFFQYVALMPESITRARRKLQEQGRYLPTKEVEDQRYQQFVDAKYSAGKSIIEGSI